MKNPVFAQIEKTAIPVEQAQPSHAETLAGLEAAYRSPAADAVDMGRMTYDDVVVKTLVCLAVLVAGASSAWFLVSLQPQIASFLLGAGLVVGLGLALFASFSKKIRPAVILGYSLAEGLAIGALSAVTEKMLPGVVLQALIATVVVFAVTLALFASGKVRNSPKMMKFTLIALLGIIISRVLIMILAATGVVSSQSGVSIFGIPLGVALSVFAVVVGALCLIGDFDQVQYAVRAQAPTAVSWQCAFGIMVTVVWIYVEILNILTSLASRD